MLKTRKMHRFWFLTLIFFIYSSCNPYPGSLRQVADTPKPSVTQQATLVAGISATPVPHSTTLPTLTPTILLTSTVTRTATITPTHLPTLTWTPQNTMLPETVIPYVDQLFENNFGCQLPCWWDITPGKTTWQNARDFLGKFSEIRESVSPKNPSILVGEATFRIPQHIFPRELMTHAYVIRDGLVESIEIRALGNVEGYLLSKFLQNYGEPDEVWISTYQNFYTNEGVSTLPFMIALFYPGRGILAYTGSNSTSVRNGFVIGCDNNHILSSLYLWSPEKKMNFDQAARWFRIQSGDMIFYPLDQATTLSTTEFYESFRSGEDHCLQSPVDLWPGQ